MLSYADLIAARDRFRSVDRTGMNRFESPASVYFKPMFYFTDGYGLLGMDGIDFNGESNVERDIKGYTPVSMPGTAAAATDVSTKKLHDTAFYYLALNGETDRVTYLKQFIQLLSELSSNCPWYFQEIQGLDVALKRNDLLTKEAKVADDRRSITITCLPDAYDTRIGTLLDLYRSICWSHTMKRSILPSNLRRFNMGVLIFNTQCVFNSPADDVAKTGIPDQWDTNEYVASAKLVQLRNCEIDIDSSTSAIGTLKNDEPNELSYTITITYDDAYEYRFNEMTSMLIGDVIMSDIGTQTGDQSIKVDTLNSFNTNGLINQLVSAAKSKASQALNKLYLGNLGGMSVANASSIIQTSMNGGIIAGGFMAASQIRNTANASSDGKNPKKPLGKLPGTDVVWQRQVMSRAKSLANNL